MTWPPDQLHPRMVERLRPFAREVAEDERFWAAVHDQLEARPYFEEDVLELLPFLSLDLLRELAQDICPREEDGQV